MINNSAQGNTPPYGITWAADNGAGSGKDGTIGKYYPGDEVYLAWLASLSDRAALPVDRRDMGVRPALERHPEHQPGRRPAQRFPPPPVPAASPDGDRSPGRTPAMTKP